MLASKLIDSSAQEWFGMPLRLIPDADVFRFRAAQRAAEMYINYQHKRRSETPSRNEQQKKLLNQLLAKGDNDGG